jgi:small subunit ribosomal protein S16
LALISNGRKAASCLSTNKGHAFFPLPTPELLVKSPTLNASTNKEPMPTTIRLSRAGAKKRPYYRILVTNSRSPRDSKFIEKIGSYNPLLANGDPKRVTINTDRAKYWLSVGATMSERIHLFFNQAGLVSSKPAQRAARAPKKDKGAAAEGAPAVAALAAEAPKEAPAAETAA